MKKTILLLILLPITIITLSQSQDLIIKKNKKGIINYVEFQIDNQTQQSIPKNANDFFHNYLLINENDAFIKTKEKQSSGGFEHVYYDQYFNGVKVEKGGYNIHYKNSKMQLAHGNYIKIKELNTVPSITNESAAQIFASAIEVPYNIVKKTFADLMIIEHFKNEQYYPDEVVLVYKIYLDAEHKNNTFIGYVNAHTGSLVLKVAILNNLSATGTFETLYNGSKQATTDFYNSTYNLNDPTRGDGIHTKNAKGVEYIYTNTSEDLTDADNIWTASEHSTNNNQMGLDIHWGLQKIYD